jgi:hypothetical protein
MSMSKRIDARIRFWNKVKITEEDKCWIWLGTMRSSHKEARGVFFINGHAEAAHRVAYMLTNGNIPKDKFICHTCDNRYCVNPKHLFVGDALSNNRDSYSKGRHPILRGDNDPKAKLKGYEVLEMVDLYKTGRYTQAGLAQKYSVSRGAILAILRGDNWKHLTNITKPLNLFPSSHRPERSI